MITLAQFKQSLSLASPPADYSVYLKALWWDDRDDWERSHTTIQDVPGEEAAWIHAYLHRKEGDIGNADYWYRRAGRKRSSLSLDEEWEEIVQEMLNMTH